METFSDMKTAVTTYNNWGDDDINSDSDWALCMKHATFLHKEECEFIFYIGSDDEGCNYREDTLEEYTRLGFSEEFLQLVKDAQAQKYVYLLIYN